MARRLHDRGAGGPAPLVVSGRGAPRRSEDVNARTTLHRALAVWLSAGLVHAAAPVRAAETAKPGPARRHVVDQAEVARRLLDGAQTREQRVRLFQEALATSEAQKRARAMGADPARLRAAVPHLTDRELAELHARATQVKDVAAGHGGSDGALILIGVMLLVAGIVVLAVTYEDDYYHDDYWDDCWCY
jgi:hypothetical protein